jgi:predicted MFS family arabinose efflux permease
MMDQHIGAAAPDQELSAGQQEEQRPGAYAWYVVVVLMLCYVLSMIDRKFPFILVESIKADLKLSDTQIGLLTGIMFAAVYSILAIPVASLADRLSRKTIIGGAIFVWSGLTAMGGFAQNFVQLAGSRAGVAIGESACSPAAHSMIADYFPRKFRARALGLYFAGAHVGALLGLVLGGWINDLANWRVAMMMLGAPGVVMALLFITTVREPPRRPHVEAPVVNPDRPGMREAMVTLCRLPVFVHLMIAAICFMFTSGAVQAFSPAYIMRTWGYSSEWTGLTYGMAAGLAGISGSLLGGLVGDRLLKHRWQGLAFVGTAFAIAAPAMFVAYIVHSYALFLLLLFISQVGDSTYAGPSFATLQSLVSPRMHAVASAIYLFALSGIGVSLGPVVAGMISDHLKADGVANPLRWALMLIVIPKVLASVHYFLAARRLRRSDEAIPEAPIAAG